MLAVALIVIAVLVAWTVLAIAGALLAGGIIHRRDHLGAPDARALTRALR